MKEVIYDAVISNLLVIEALIEVDEDVSANLKLAKEKVKTLRDIMIQQKREESYDNKRS